MTAPVLDRPAAARASAASPRPSWRGPARPPEPPRDAPEGRAPSDLGPALALLLTTVTAAAGLGRLFTGTAYLRCVVGAALAGHVLAWLARRLRVPSVLGTLTSAAVTAVVLTAELFPGTAWHSLPTGRTVTAARLALEASWHEFQTVRAPVPPTAGFVLAATVAVWLAAVLADGLAFRARLTAEAVFPASTVVVFTAGFATDRYRWPAIGAYVAAASVFGVAARAHDRAANLAWIGGIRPRRARWLAPAAGVAVLATAAAVLVTPHLPGAASEGAFDWRHAGRTKPPKQRVALSPMVTVRSRLVQQADTEQFTVTAVAPAYWRLTALETFDGEQWTSTASYRTANGRLPTTGELPPAVALDQEIRLGALDSAWLPAAYRPIAVDVPRGASYDPFSGSLIADHDVRSGDSYRVQSAVPTLDRAIVAGARGATDPGPVYLSVPASIPPTVRELAFEVVRGASTPYGKARMLQDFFRSSFTYDLSVPSGASAQDLTAFLFRVRRGYCEQFAAAYATLGRIVGLPTRVAVGFAPGQPDGSGTFHVLGRDAHAWPEVYLDDLGWVGFEPTPGRSIPGGESYTGVPPQSFAPLDTPTTVPPTTAPESSPGAPTTTVAPAGEAPDGATRRDGGVPAAALVLLIAAVVLLLVFGGASGRAVRRTLCRRRARTPEARVEAAWTGIVEALSWAGVEHRRSDTPATFARRAAGVLSEATAVEVVALADLVAAGRYGAAAIGAEAAARAAALEATVDEEVDRWLPVGRRVRRWVDPRAMAPGGGVPVSGRA